MNQYSLQFNQDENEVMVFGNKEKRIAVSNLLVPHVTKKTKTKVEKLWFAERARSDLDESYQINHQNCLLSA